MISHRKIYKSFSKLLTYDGRIRMFNYGNFVWCTISFFYWLFSTPMMQVCLDIMIDNIHCFQFKLNSKVWFILDTFCVRYHLKWIFCTFAMLFPCLHELLLVILFCLRFLGLDAFSWIHLFNRYSACDSLGILLGGICLNAIFDILFVSLSVNISILSVSVIVISVFCNPNLKSFHFAF